MTDLATKHQTSTITGLKEAGWKVFGYYCCYVPVEILTAAHIIPYRITGDLTEQITEADNVLEKVMCPWVRNSFDQALKGKYSFLDGIIVPHVCDAVQRMYALWKYYVKLPFIHQFDVPHIFSASSFNFLAKELTIFKNSLEEFIGHKITDEELGKAIDLHNENRRLVRELYTLRKPQPPLISGVEVLNLLKTGMGLPVTEFNRLLEDAINDVKNRPAPAAKNQPRLMVSGCVIDNDQFFSVVEDSGAQVVMDDLPLGTRSFWFQVEKGPDLMASLSRAYLEGIRCPRTVEGTRTEPYKEEMADRWGYLINYAKDFKVDGVILNLLRFCDCHEYDFIDLKGYLQDSGFPAMVIDDDYTPSSILRVKTRVEAFVETLQEKA